MIKFLKNTLYSAAQLYRFIGDAVRASRCDCDFTVH